MHERLQQAESLQNILVSHATGTSEDDKEYQRLRAALRSDLSIAHLLPDFIKDCRSLPQFWWFIQPKFEHYAERRKFIWDAFAGLLSYLERGGAYPSDEPVSTLLERFDAANVHNVWTKALDRRETDPEGAITTARTLLESVCKHILDEEGEQYGDADLPKLYRLVANALNIAPSQHTEQVFRQILGGCTSVVEGLGSLRNRMSDSHGKGKNAVRLAPPTC